MLAVAARTPSPPALPDSIEGLSPGEHLLVWSLRAIAAGHGDCAVIGQTFGALCGPMGPAAHQAHFALVQLIGLAARRPLRVHAPGCICLGADEAAVVGVVAAAQQALTSDDSLLRARLGFLVRTQSAETLRCAALALARVMALGGQTLPVRMEPALAHEEPGPLRVVH